MLARAAARLGELGRRLARPQVTSRLKAVLFLLTVAAGIGLLVARIQAIKRRATESTTAGTDEVADEWPTGRKDLIAGTDGPGDPLPLGAIARLGTTRLRPTMEVRQLSFSPDGKRLLSRASSVVRVPDRLTVWDALTGRQLQDMELPNNYNCTCSWLKNGHIVALLTGDRGKLQVWDFGEQGLARLPFLPPATPAGATLTGDDQEYDRSLAVAPNGELVAVGRSGQVKDRPRWIDLRVVLVGKDVEDLETVRRLGPHPGCCDHLLFSADGRLLLVMTDPDPEEGKALVSLWEVAGGEKVAEQKVPLTTKKYIRPGMALSPDGRTFALGSSDGKAHLFDLVGGQEKHSLSITATPERQGAVTALVFSPDGKHLVAGSPEDGLHVFETATGRAVWARRGHYFWGEPLAVSPDGKRIASGGDGQIRLWDAASGENLCPLEGHEEMVTAVAVSPDGRRVVTSSFDDRACVWETETGRLLRCIDVGKRSWSRFTFTPDGRKLLGKSEYRLQLRDAATGAALPLPGRLADHPCSWAAFAPDGKTLVTIAKREALVWEWPAGRLLRRFEVRPDAPASARMFCAGLSFSPDSRKLLILTGFEQGRGSLPAPPRSAADVWDITSGKYLRRLVSSPAYLPMGGFLADGSSALLPAGVVSWEVTGDAKRLGGVLACLDVHTGKVGQVFPAGAEKTQAEQGRLSALACSADGRVVAGAVGRGTVLLYEAATGLPRRKLRGHRREVMALSFTPDSKRLITGSVDTTALVWDVGLTALAQPEELPPEQLWADLASMEPKTVNRTLASLAAAPALAVTLFRERLCPAKGHETSAEHVRQVRALEVFEDINTPEARSVLAGLAKGAPEAWLTQEARACLDRLAVRAGNLRGARK